MGGLNNLVPSTGSDQMARRAVRLGFTLRPLRLCGEMLSSSVYIVALFTRR